MTYYVKTILHACNCNYVIEWSTYLDLARSAKTAILSIATCHEVQYGKANNA